MIALWLFLFCFHSTTSQWSDDTYNLIGRSLVSIGGSNVAVTCDRLGMNPCLQVCEGIYSEPLLIAMVRECSKTEQQIGDDCYVTPPKKYGPKCKNKGCQGWNSAAVLRIPTSPAPANYTECVLTCDDALNHYCYETCGNQTQVMSQQQLTIDDVSSKQKCIMDTLKTLSQCLKDAVRVN